MLFVWIPEKQTSTRSHSEWKALYYINPEELDRVNEASENNTISNVTVQLGGTAFLHCKLRNFAERAVSDAEVSLVFTIFTDKLSFIISIVEFRIDVEIEKEK